MDGLSARMLQIRKAEGLSQAAFGKKLNLSQNFIWAVENGQREPSDRTISDICREFNVSETWLRTGEGEMHLPKSRGEEIGEIVRGAAQTDPEEAVKFFQSLLDGMSDAEIVLMYQIFKKHFLGKQ